MLTLELAEVENVLEEWPEMQILRVVLADGQRGKAVCYRHSGTCAAGDQVLINTTAVKLGLGTGGYHFVVAKQQVAGKQEGREMCDDVYPTRWGHVMKLRYTPLQMAVDAIEEQHSPHHPLLADETLTLDGTPVLIGELHSLLPVLVLVAKQLRPDARLVYLMPDGAALPLAISQQVRTLRQQQWLAATVTTGHAYGGEIEAVNIPSGLLAAKWVGNADLIICLLGPGVVGTGTPYGFSGMQLAEAVHAVSILGGIPVFVPRLAFGDSRTRHKGLSHHTRTLLRRFVLRPVLVPIPQFGDERDELLARQMDEDRWQESHVPLRITAPHLEDLLAIAAGYPLPITTMGRSLAEEPAPFQTACLAAQLAVRLLGLKAEFVNAWPAPDERAILARLAACLTGGEA